MPSRTLRPVRSAGMPVTNHQTASPMSAMSANGTANQPTTKPPGMAMQTSATSAATPPIVAARERGGSVVWPACSGASGTSSQAAT